MGAQKMFRNFDNMSWPAPCEEMDNLAYSLRYNSVLADYLYAASIVDAYMELVYAPKNKRDKVIREIRKGPNTGKYNATEKSNSSECGCGLDRGV